MTAPTLLETFRALSTFSPGRRSLAGAPWEVYVSWATSNGLAPLAAYDLEYRLAGGDAPEWVRDKLLAVYQGTANDNVLKMVNFKRIVANLEGLKVVLIGGANFAETLYPHIAFRPVIDISLLVRAGEIERLSRLLSDARFEVARSSRVPGAVASFTDGRTVIHLFCRLFGPSLLVETQEMLDRALPARVYGPSIFRLTAEDAILLLCLEHARAGYDVPYVSFVDLRELLLGAASVTGPYSKPLSIEEIRSRASALKLDRALYASCGIVAELFPETRHVVAAVRPRISRVLGNLLDRALVHPLGRLLRMRQLRGANRLRRILIGPRNLPA